MAGGAAGSRWDFIPLFTLSGLREGCCRALRPREALAEGTQHPATAAAGHRIRMRRDIQNLNSGSMDEER